MPKRLAFLYVLALFSSTSALAQNVNDLLNLFRGAVQQSMVQAAQSEWRRLPPAELSCLDQALRQQGASVDALANRGVMPTEPALAQLRSDCRGQIAQIPQATAAQPFPYVVDGLALGGQVRFESEAYKRYRCAPSENFPGFTWCHKEETKKENQIEITSSNSILHTEDGTAWYVNRYIEPAFFAPNDLQNEIDRLSAKFGEQARYFRMPQREGLPNAVIAVWGKIQLEPLDASDVSTVASGRSVKGLLVNFLSDLARSARAGLPVYRLGGGAGFLWAATFNSDGRGVLRFLTIDASQITSPNVAQPPTISPQQGPMTAQTPIVRPPELPAQEFARLLEVPKSCLAVRQAGPPQFPHPPGDPLCTLKRDCFYTLSPQINALIGYLRARPLLTVELRKQPLPYFFTSFDRLLEDLQRAGIVNIIPGSAPYGLCVSRHYRIPRQLCI